ncbi:MAG: hypothetical protein LAP87_03865 [Acidobacteriia bacterium]|nr:hypothetical protein [Terriglobia bacterium]
MMGAKPTLLYFVSVLIQVSRVVFERRQQPARFLFVVAGLLFAVLALLAIEYGSFSPYAVLASIFLLQAIDPTLIGWLLVLAICATDSTIYLYATVRDAVELARGLRSTIFTNPGDIVLLSVCLAFVAALVFLRPKPLP